MAKPDSEGFEHVALIRHADLDVTLLVRPTADPSQREFIGFLIDNKTGRPIDRPPSGNYRIDNAQRFDRATQQLVSTGSLASGNDYDLFYRDVIDSNTVRLPLPIGESRRMEYASGYSLGLLGIPDQGSQGFTIKATVHLDLDYNGQRLSTPPAGVPIQFDWLAPDEAGIEQMKLRLRDVLRGGDPGQRQYYVLATLLDHPSIGPSITTADLISGLSAWGQRGSKILQYLDAHRKQEPGLVDYALGVIDARDHLRMLVLRHSTSLHDARLIEPLNAWATGQPSFQGAELALELLSKQLDLAPDRDALTADLGKAWLARSPITRSGRFKRGEGWRWVGEVRLLALTGDHHLIPILLPYLDRREVVIDAREISAANNGISTRACDTAYNAILDLLGRDGERLELKFGVLPPARPNLHDEYARRDALIAKLRQELPAR